MLRNIISQLQTNPLNFLASMLIQIPAVLLAITFHEVAHGYVAKRCGDPTAYMMGRLSLNPIKHLDPVGTLCMLFLGYGWAKPVPVNPRNFRNYKRDDLLVSVAGVTVNLALFFITSLLMVLVNQLMFDPTELARYYNLNAETFLSVKQWGFWSIYSGATAQFVEEGLVRAPFLLYVQRFFAVFSMVNLGLAIFNLLPIPPLDGYHVVNDILLKGRLVLTPQMHMVFTFGLMFLCFGTNLVSNLMQTVTNFLQSNLMHFFLMIFGIQ